MRCCRSVIVGGVERHHSLRGVGAAEDEADRRLKLLLVEGKLGGGLGADGSGDDRMHSRHEDLALVLIGADDDGHRHVAAALDGVDGYGGHAARRGVDDGEPRHDGRVGGDHRRVRPSRAVGWIWPVRTAPRRRVVHELRCGERAHAREDGGAVEAVAAACGDVGLAKRRGALNRREDVRRVAVAGLEDGAVEKARVGLAVGEVRAHRNGAGALSKDGDASRVAAEGLRVRLHPL